MRRGLTWGAWWRSCLVAVIALSGCASKNLRFGKDSPAEQPTVESSREIEYSLTEIPPVDNLIGSGTPRQMSDSERLAYWDMSLQEAIHLALHHSKVMRDLGGKVLRAPESVPTAIDPAIQETDPRHGVEGALSAFDAQFSTSLFAERNDRRLNNRSLGTQGLFTQDFDVFQTEITKRAVSGSQFSFRHGFDFDKNNNTGNQFQDGAWNAILEGEFRHSLLQGSGVDFNRIAGPDSAPGVYNGVLIARIRTDISLADFQMGLRDLVSDVENAYWDLYFAYRDLDTKVKARDDSLTIWRRVNARAGQAGAEADKEAQAREQYYRFEADVQNALMGRPLEGTRRDNGSRPGTFRPTPGVYSAERRLRLLVGLPPNEERVIRPLDEPPAASFVFDWYSVASEALSRRPELRRQKWEVKARELELTASRNYLRPELDVVGRYRWRGFGDDLLDSNRNGTRFDNAYGDLTSGDFQEWQMGVEMSLPIGFRQGHTAVRNAQFRLSRARCLLREQQRQVLHDLSSAISEVNRAYHLLQTNINRVHAAKRQKEALETVYKEESRVVEFFVLLDAQRRYFEALRIYYQSRVEYALALRNVHFEQGVLLDYCQLWLAEGSWPGAAYDDAARRERRRGRPKAIDYRIKRPPVIAGGHLARSPAIVPKVSAQRSQPEPAPTPTPTLPSLPYSSPNAGQIPAGPGPGTGPRSPAMVHAPTQGPSLAQPLAAPPIHSANVPRVQPLPRVEIATRPGTGLPLR